MPPIATYRAPGAVIDYTPSGADVAAGDVVVLGEIVAIATQPIADGELGALAVEGIFDIPKVSGSSTAIAAGETVYWDAGNDEGTSDDDSGANKKAGFAVADTVDGDTSIRIKLSR
jgi:predicted RecA/RadA family phage recombinase